MIINGVYSHVGKLGIHCSSNFHYITFQSINTFLLHVGNENILKVTYKKASDQSNQEDAYDANFEMEDEGNHNAAHWLFDGKH